MRTGGGFAGLYSAAAQGRFTADCDQALDCHNDDMSKLMTPGIAAEFERESMVVLHGVLTPEEVMRAHADLCQLKGDGTMRPNPQAEKWKNKRDDDIALLGTAHLGDKHPGLRRAIELVRGVPHALQQQGNCEADVEVPREVMVACYDGSADRPAKHQPHRDNAPVPGTPGENAREITILLYLNPHWQSEWGGQLRCHTNAAVEDQVGVHPETVDVQPIGGTMVIFKSRVLLRTAAPAPPARVLFQASLTELRGLVQTR